MKLILRQINAKNKNMPITIEHINIDTELIQREDNFLIFIRIKNTEI